MSTARIDELRSKFDENPRRYFAPLANEYRKAGDLAQAIALCREHLPKQPGHMSGYIVFGQALYENGELAEAQDVFQSALELDPENLIALRHLGDIARTRGDAGAARRWYERVLDADPRNDDIAALLATLAQRHTPRAATPIASMPAVEEQVAAYGVDDDPFSAPDSPAWHTPSFLTPLGSAAVPAGPDAAQTQPVSEAGAEDLLDLDFSAEALNAVEAEVADHADHVAHGGFDDPAGDAPDLADPEVATSAAAVQDAPHSSDDMPDTVADTAAEAVADESVEEVADEAATAQLGELAVGDDAFDASESAVSGDDALTAALGAFAAHDPIEIASDLPMVDAEPASWTTRSAVEVNEYEPELPSDAVDQPLDVTRAESEDAVLDELPSSAAAAPFVYPTETYGDDEAFEEGLVAQEWPDASALSGRHFSPSRGVTPVHSEAVTDAFGETASGGDEADAPQGSASPESSAESLEHLSADRPAELSIEGTVVEAAAAVDAGDAAGTDDVVEALDAELIEDNALEEIDDRVVEATQDDTVEAAQDDAVDATQDDMVEAAQDDAVEATQDDAVEATQDDSAEASDDSSVEATAEEVRTAEAAFDGFDAFAESEREALVDEDPPVSAADIPWLSVAEEEREADEELALEDAEPQHAELSSAPESPAFVTETMAELLVAQGFVDRAITVYEELVARRPYDAVLSSRLTELQAMKETESASESAGEVDSDSGSQSDSEVAAESSPAFTPAPMPAWSATPIRGGTPVRSATPFRSLSPVASPALPLVAPPARRTARELFATLASMRVARRTPAFGSATVGATVGATVAMPTPADGLASLFGETAAPQDDHSARSLASAFGSGEGVEPGPSLFAAAGPDELSPFGAAPAPAQPSPVSPPHASGSAFSFDRFFPDPATTGASAAPTATPGVSQTPASGVASGSGDAEQSAGPSSAGADLAQFSHWLKGLSNS